MYRLTTKKLDAELILHILKNQNMGIPELAVKCGISREMLYKYLGFRKKTSRIRLSNLTALATALSVKEETLIKYDNPVTEMARIRKYQVARIKMLTSRQPKGIGGNFRYDFVNELEKELENIQKVYKKLIEKINEKLTN